MNFFEEISAALDSEGIESRVNGDTMFVPITFDLEIQFQEIDPLLPAANVYIAAANVDEDDEDFDAVLVSVVFSVEDALDTVSQYVATDQVVTVLRDLLEGTDERIGELEFYQDSFDAHLVRAAVGHNSELHVHVDIVDGIPTASVSFIALRQPFESLDNDGDDNRWDDEDDDILSAEVASTLTGEFIGELYNGAEELLDLGTFSDFDRLFDVISLADDQAEDWEEQLLHFDEEEYDEPDVYDIFVDDSDEDFEDDYIDEDIDESEDTV